MRRRRRQKFTWFPVNGTQIVDVENSYNAAAFIIDPVQANASNGVSPASVTFPVVPDYSEFSRFAGESEATLRDQVEGQEWLLKRIVGKFHLEVEPTVATAGAIDAGVQWVSLLVTVGLFVARAADSNQAVVDMFAEGYDVANYENVANPWLFRRTWHLAVPFIVGSNAGFFYGSVLPSNTNVGSVAEGSHIDSKVARRIHREHRLWLQMAVQGGDAAQIVSVSGASNTQARVKGLMDLRVLGALRKAKNRSSF